MAYILRYDRIQWIQFSIILLLQYGVAEWLLLKQWRNKGRGEEGDLPELITQEGAKCQIIESNFWL